MVNGTIVSRFIRLPLGSFVPRFNYNRRARPGSPQVFRPFRGGGRGRSLPWFSDTLHAPKTIVRPFPRSDRIHRVESIPTYSWVERRARNRYVSRCGAIHGRVFLFADIDGVTLRFSVHEGGRNRRDRERMAYVYTHS